MELFHTPSRIQTQRIKCWLIILCSCLFFYCSGGKKQKVDKSAPEIIKQLVPKQVDDCTICPSYIAQYTWNNQTIYVYSCGGATCNCAKQLYDGQGNKIPYDAAVYMAFDRESKYVKFIWRCKD
ncbi:MAG: hypothetical protein INR73_14455 [Williamsia sp.]|nr:hypothetical protein [Williamsia sp.]